MKRILIGIGALLVSGAALAAGLNQYQPGFRTIDGSQLNKMVNVVNGLTGNGGTVSTGYFSANTTGTTGPTPSTGVIVQAVGANATPARIELDAFANTPIVTLKRFDGTKAAPTVLLSNDQIGSYNFAGATSATAIYGPAARISSFTTENWSGTAGGTKVVISTTPNTTQTLTDVATFGQDGSLTISGTISAAGLTISGASFNNAVIGTVVGMKAAAGSIALDGSNPTTVATGLTTVVSCSVNIVTNSIPSATTNLSYTISTASLNIYGYRPSTVSVTTLVASTGTDLIGWSCFGT